MANGSSRLIKDIIDDTNKSVRTTYSSDMIEALLGATGANSTVYLKAVSDTAPTAFSIHEKYYNTTTKLVYEATSNTKWGTGVNPSRNTLYVDLQNNKMYTYENGKLNECSGVVKISDKDNNALKQQDDESLYVKDLSQEVNRINIAQKTVNEGLDYLLCDFSNQTLSLNTRISFTKVTGNMEITSNTIKLQQGKTYKIDINIPAKAQNASPDNIYELRDVTNNTRLYQFNPVVVSYYCNGDTASTIYTPENDCEIAWVPTLLTAGSTTRSNAVITVTEIGRVATIDPVSYIDINQGIQDTPVGQTITMQGLPNKVDHYLLCDGSEYNIVDYPHLAQYIKDAYGSEYYFGGSGLTFKVPNDGTNFSWWSPQMTGPESPAPYKSWSNNTLTGVSDFQPWLGLQGSAGNYGYHSTNALSASNPAYWYFDNGNSLAIKGFKIASRAFAGCDVRTPITVILEGSDDNVTYITIHTGGPHDNFGFGQYLEVELPNVVNYRYYRLKFIDSNAGDTTNTINISDWQFLVLNSSKWIKYQPTYFIGSINGMEIQDELLDTPQLINAKGLILRNIPLNKSIEDYDYIEIEHCLPYNNIDLCIRTDRIKVSSIEYNTSSSDVMPNSYWRGSFSLTNMELNNFTTALEIGFRNSNTLYVGRHTYNNNIGTNSYNGTKIRAVRGIRNNYKIN